MRARWERDHVLMSCLSSTNTEAVACSLIATGGVSQRANRITLGDVRPGDRYPNSSALPVQYRVDRNEKDAAGNPNKMRPPDCSTRCCVFQGVPSLHGPSGKIASNRVA